MAGAAAAALRALRCLAATFGRCSAPAGSVPPPALRALCPAWRSSQVRSLQLRCVLCAGHNKWSKVKHVKGPKDEARGRMFTKFGMMIKIAVKEGGPNPDMNLNLAHIVEQCRSKNMPKASIEAAIKSAEKAKPTSQHLFEARGPGGCLLLIEVLTDSNARSLQEIKRLLAKNGGMLSDGARNNFNRRGVVLVPGQNIPMEQALELALEAGAEDVQETEDEDEQPLLQFICDMTALKKVRSSLEKLGMQVLSAGLEFVPRTLLPLDQYQLDAASTLIESLNDYPDVVRVWDNIQADG
ncbi:translational activator of cytochrome c oxidase 1 [Betta splendens]|uniref:Translational activator of cytochrome c oxidase 1 n=1 Tax=Betta splendens TaxID=158456 RepID=A0A6P7LBC8_BETSP|nr:translational activator of cytochrome c oxidase 1 [Betta splendens]